MEKYVCESATRAITISEIKELRFLFHTFFRTAKNICNRSNARMFLLHIHLHFRRSFWLDPHTARADILFYFFSPFLTTYQKIENAIGYGPTIERSLFYLHRYFANIKRQNNSLVMQSVSNIISDKVLL